MQILNLIILSLPTAPGPVSDFRVTSVSTREIGLAWSSNDSESFRILTKGAGKLGNDTTTNQSITIGGLRPGTSYHFEIFPQGPNGTEGTPQTVDGRTGKQVSRAFCQTVMFLKGNVYDL